MVKVAHQYLWKTPLETLMFVEYIQEGKLILIAAQKSQTLYSTS